MAPSQSQEKKKVFSIFLWGHSQQKDLLKMQTAATSGKIHVFLWPPCSASKLRQAYEEASVQLAS